MEHLYNPDTHQMLNTDLSYRFTLELEAVWKNMMAAGVPAVEAMAFMAEHGSVFRCEAVLEKMSAQWRKKEA